MNYLNSVIHAHYIISVVGTNMEILCKVGHLINPSEVNFFIFSDFRCYPHPRAIAEQSQTGVNYTNFVVLKTILEIVVYCILQHLRTIIMRCDFKFLIK